MEGMRSVLGCYDLLLSVSAELSISGKDGWLIQGYSFMNCATSLVSCFVSHQSVR